ncbi:MAG: hypothetical protein NVS1B10_06640 [Candidatus Saccharimonadales bacterium]
MSHVSRFITKKDGRAFEVLIDEQDAPLYDSKRWYIKDDNTDPRHNQHFYAIHRPGRAGRARGEKTLRLHRAILNAPAGLEVDHINGNGLDNRRINLRLATAGQNRLNQRKTRVQTTSVYKGVSFQDNRWCAEISHKNGSNRARMRLGRYVNEADAAKAYDEAASKLFGEFASVNFPKLAVS